MRKFSKNRFYFVLLVSLQVADWAFTLTGIYAFGTSVEGNFLFRFLFQHFHWMAVITFFKSVVVVGSFYLYNSGRHGAVRLGAIYYFLIVFCPWVYGLGVLTKR
ncbi:MAG: hypothetical protein DMG06_29420 [Acidobacteria bacterium]|nr:MAG: hypothetical protein DMG06_29420 [Acidobacteriota bacterium]